jgi:hypothetical protein
VSEGDREEDSGCEASIEVLMSIPAFLLSALVMEETSVIAEVVVTASVSTAHTVALHGSALVTALLLHGSELEMEMTPVASGAAVAIV